MIKLKTLLFENVYFENHNTIMVINTPKGPWKFVIYVKERKDTHKIYYQFSADSPPNHYSNYEVNGKMHKMAVGGQRWMGTAKVTIHECQEELKEFLKKQGLSYINYIKLVPIDTTSAESKRQNDEFLKKLNNVVADFRKEMQKPENQPKDFGKGPMSFGQWVSAEDVKNGRLKWVIDNYGDFWLVIKWALSPRQIIKASEFLKNYDRIMRGKNNNDDYAREVFVRDKPFEGI
jgi:hypothetical protein